jgi:hypothetical protein
VRSNYTWLQAETVASIGISHGPYLGDFGKDLCGMAMSVVRGSTKARQEL